LFPAHRTMATTQPPLRDGIFPRLLIRRELERVESSIRAQIHAFDPAVEPYVGYICDTPGKRIRPALSILVGGACGGVSVDHIKLGVIVELIHMATLVHDDIIDGAETRRMEPTANAKWGNSLSVLLGDALFSHALTLATDFDSIDICRRVGRAARDVCQGEIIQTQRRFDLTFTKEDYFKVIGMKTGALFAIATGIAATLSGLDEESAERLHAYGMKLGTAYQIYDDCLDLVGSEDRVGKTLRTDLLKGKLTLPILNLLETASESQRIKLNRRILNQEPLDLPVLLGIAEYAGAVESAVDTALRLIDECRDALDLLAPSPYRNALDQIGGYLAGLLQQCRK